ncbi:MAG: hypothetical protein J6X80_02685 [Lachnospiraceae bacterium]|nr:hypothetical protein [Lachnospiraceae bacterium]
MQNDDALISMLIAGGSILYFIFLIVYCVVMIALSVVLLFAMWKLFVKAGQPGWASLIPGYNFWVVCDIAFNNNIMWFIFMFIPFLNIVAMFVSMYAIAKTFNKGTGFAILSIFFYVITIPILAFGKAEYDPRLKL